MWKVALRSAVRGVLAASLAVLPGLAHGQATVNHLYDKFQFGASGVDAVLSPTFRVDNADGTQGTEVSFSTLGLSQSAFSPRVGVAWRPWRRHQFALSYLYANRTGGRTLSDTVRFADTSFAAGLKVNSQFGAPALSFGYEFSIFAKEKLQAGVLLSLGATFFNMGIDAVAGTTAGGPDTTIVKYGVSKNLVGPTAAVGVFGNFRVGERWYLLAQGGAIGATVSNVEVTTWVLIGGARYFFSDRFGLQASYGYNGIDATVAKNDFTGNISYSAQTIGLGVILALQ